MRQVNNSPDIFRFVHFFVPFVFLICRKQVLVEHFEKHSLNNGNRSLLDFKLAILAEPDKSYNFETPHRHEYFTLIFLQKGESTHDIDFKSYQSGAQTVHFVHSSAVHLFLRSPDSFGVSLMFMEDFVGNELIRKLPFGKTTPILKVSSEEFESLFGIVKDICAEWDSQDVESLFVIKASLSAILWKLQRIYRTSVPESATTENNLLFRFEDRILKSLVQHRSVESYATELGISPRHFISSIRQITGKTPLQIIHEKMISEAKRLLFFTPLSVKEISNELNFSDTSNFSKFFKRETGYTPLEYREGIRHEITR